MRQASSARWVVSVLLTTSAATAHAASDLAPLLARRDALVAALEKQPQPQEVLLRLDDGADRDDAWITLRRCGGQWRSAFAEVPGWHQTTMKDWRGYFHCNFTHGCWRPNLRWPGDAAGLALGDERLAGTLDIAYQLDMPTAQRLPAGEYAQWWDKFIPGGHTTPRPVRYTVEADVAAGSAMLELILDGGVYWDSKFVPNPKAPDSPSVVSRRPIVVRLQVPATRFTHVAVKTPSWVGGFHEADPTGLTYADGKLTGMLVVFLQQDGWAPWGRGKHTQHESLAVRFELDARLERNDITGRYTASLGGELKGRHYNPRGDDSESVTLPETRYEGAVRGRGGRLIVGRYTAQGAFGDSSGAVDGMLLDGRPVRERVALPDGEVTVERIGVVLHQIRALHLALQCPGLPYEAALRQTDRPAPVTADVAEYLACALRAADALQEPGAKPPAVEAETAGDSPSFGAVAAPVEGETVNVFPADSSQWYYLSRWQVLGGFEQRLGLEHNTALAPDIVVLPSAGYQQPADRFGILYPGGATQRWQAVECADSRVGAPWERPNIFPRFVGQVWWGTAALRSEKARTVWFSVEANDFGKLWVNDRLVWTDTERAWRYRAFGRTFVPVELAAGENRIVGRIHSDRQVSWLRLAVTAHEPKTPSLPNPPAVANNPFVFADARPPLAWDVSKGINVAWRAPALGGNTRPVVADDSLFVTGGTNELTCVDPATGSARWSRRLVEAPLTPGGGAAQAEPPGEPVSDGKRIAFLGAGGTLACYDLAGTLLWSQPTALHRPRLRLCGGRFVTEGQVPSPGGRSAPSPTVRLMAFDAATGAEAWRRDLPGTMSGGGAAVELDGASAVLSCAGAWMDAASGALLPPLDAEMQSAGKDGSPVRTVTADPYRRHYSAGMLFLTSQARHVALRLWARDGRPGFAQAWESNYGSSGFGNVAAPGAATDRYLFTWHSSAAHTPHSPDPRAEVNVQDARNGRWMARLKPVMTDLYSYGPLNLATPVVAGGYLFLLGGRSDNSRNQIAVVSADERLQLVARQDVEPGTQQPPVFTGDRMFLRSARSLLCVALTTPDGRQYQSAQLARTLLAAIGREPKVPPLRDVPAIDHADPLGKTPIGRIVHDLPTEFWLGAGPFAAGSLNDSAGLGNLRPETSTVFAGTVFAGKPFEPLSRQYAYNEPPAYVRTGELQGTGDITPRFQTQVDPRSISSPTNSGLLYTVLDNARDCVVTPVLARRGLTQWLGGKMLAEGELLHLAPGLYPYLIRVEPEFYRIEPQEILPPVNVTNALAKGALRDVGWPGSWQVIGPLPTRATPLTAPQLREVPERLEVDGWTDRLFAFSAHGYNVDLGCLVRTTLGEEPDRSAAFVRAGVPLSAYAFAAIECPADGYLYVGTSGEASFCWYLDGAVVYDRLGGAWANAFDVSAHPFAVRVTRGRHVLAVQVRPGASGWSFCSVGGFSEKRGDELPDFTVPSKLIIPPADFRLRPCFREIPNPASLRADWLARVNSNVERLEAVIRDRPGTSEARMAAAQLAARSGGRRTTTE